MTFLPSARRFAAPLAVWALAVATLGAASGAAAAAGLDPRALSPSGSSVPGPSLETHPHRTARSYIVVLRPGVGASAARRTVSNQERALDLHATQTYTHALHGYAARMTRSVVASLRSDPAVAFVERNRRVHAVVPSAGTTSAQQSTQVVPTGVRRIAATASSTASGDGTGAVDANVAVLDTGIDPAQPDLNVVGGTRCNSPHDPVGDLNGHGTGVAGLVGALDDGGGVVGTAPGVRLWDVRVLGADGAGNLAKIICGIDWVTSTRTDPDPTNDIAVANMSFAGGGHDDGDCGNTDGDAMHQAICASAAAGVVYVAAAGNGKKGLGVQPKDIRGVTPAAYDEVLTVSAVADDDGLPGGIGSGCTAYGPDDTRATFTNFATEKADKAHLVAAPGVCQVTTRNHGGTQSGFTGTSAAAPLVTGTVALCIAESTCAGLPAPRVIKRIVTDARSDNVSDPAYGYRGDPQHPVGRTHHVTGYLIRAARY